MIVWRVVMAGPALASGRLASKAAQAVNATRRSGAKRDPRITGPSFLRAGDAREFHPARAADVDGETRSLASDVRREVVRESVGAEGPRLARDRRRQGVDLAS